MHYSVRNFLKHLAYNVLCFTFPIHCEQLKFICTRLHKDNKLLLYKGNGIRSNLNVLYEIAVECSLFKMCIRHLFMGRVMKPMEKIAGGSERADLCCKL
jgi:hypothetical protein